VTRTLAAVAAVLALLAAPAAATAQTQQEAAPSFEVVLTSISPVTTPATPLAYRVAVRNRGQAAVGNLVVTARLGRPVDTRSALGSVLANPASVAATRALDQFRPAVAEVAAGATSQLEPRQVPLPPGLADLRAGVVLPLVVTVDAQGPGGGQVSDSLTSFVIHLPAGPPKQPLRAALLVPVREPTHRNPAGDFVDDRLAGLLERRGSLGAVAAELSSDGAPAATMVVDAMLVEEATAMAGSWRLRQGGRRTTVGPGDPRSQAAAAFLQDLKRAASDHPPAAFPFGNADLPALVGAGGGARAANAVERGRDVLTQGLGTPPGIDLAWPVDGAVDGALLQTLEQTGSDVVVLDPRHLPAPPSTVTQNATVDLGRGEEPQRALVGDAVLSGALSDPRAGSAPVEWAQRILAETAVAWLERPNSSEPRGILLAPPQGWRPTRAFFRSLVRGLGQASSFLQLQPAATLAADVPQGPDEGKRLLATVTSADVAAGLPRKYLKLVEDTRSDLDSFLRAVDNDFPTASGLQRNLLVAESRDWRPDDVRATGRSYIRSVTSAIRGVYRRIHVGTTPVTLTARRGTIPVTVANESNERVTVVLRLTSPKVDLPRASDRFVLEPRRRTTQLLPVGTRATGTFPIRVDVLTPDGRERIATGEVRLISTAFNRVALALTGGAVGVLLLWWRLGRRRNGTER
jgi:Family of unknown function (DUF6049)